MGSGHMGWRAEESIGDLGTMRPNGAYEQGAWRARWVRQSIGLRFEGGVDMTRR